MSDRLILNSVEFSEVKSVLTNELALQSELSDVHCKLLLCILKARESAEDTIQTPYLFRNESALSARYKNSKYVINVANSALLSAALTLDMFVTSGIATGILTALGKNPKVLTILNEETGLLCNYSVLESWDKATFPVQAQQIEAKLSGNTCIHTELNCSFDKGGVCTISCDQISRNLQTMNEEQLVGLNLENAVQSITM